MENKSDANISQIMSLMTNSTMGSTMNECHVPVQIGLKRKMAVMSTIAILTILGNAAIIIAIIRRNCKMSRMYYLILHLSLADLLTALLTLLPEVAWTATLPQFYGGIVTCKLLKVLQLLGPYLSSYILCVTAVDRYQAICKPLQSCSWSPNKSKVMLLVAWLISLVCCLPQSFIFTIKDRSYCENTMTFQSCSHDFSGFISISGYVIFFSVANFLLPLVVLLYCYSCICQVIWTNFKQKTSAFRTEDDKTGANGELASEKNIWQVLRTCCTRSKAQQNSLELHNRQLSQVMPDMGNLESPLTVPQRKCKIVISTDRNNGEDQRQNGSIIRAVKTSPNLQPRTHSIRGITRAKMKTVKLTVTVVLGYIVCSIPFIIGQLCSVFGTKEMQDFFGTKMEFLYWLLTLNSVTNPCIYLLFNENLVQSLKNCFSGGRSGSPTIARRNTTIATRNTPPGLSSRFSLTTTTELSTNFSLKSSQSGRSQFNMID